MFSVVFLFFENGPSGLRNVLNGLIHYCCLNHIRRFPFLSPLMPSFPCHLENQGIVCRSGMWRKRLFILQVSGTAFLTRFCCLYGVQKYVLVYEKHNNRTMWNIKRVRCLEMMNSFTLMYRKSTKNGCI